MRFLVCPVCGSTNIYYEAGMIEGQKYKCNDCGYVGSFIIEMDEKEYQRFIEEKKSSRQ
ncbi:MAG: hypothetical protein RXP30_04630 [Thermoplasmata archaeon]|jgi:transcription initiation factor TFIIIB Brf1 subunit/transcription initiation factor TFIIB|nr:hypothetical protein [Thermoplasmata archaeon]